MAAGEEDVMFGSELIITPASKRSSKVRRNIRLLKVADTKIS